MFNRKFLLFASLTLVALIAVAALVWFVGPRLGWWPGGTMAFGRGLHPGGMHPEMWFGLRPDRHSFEGMMPRAAFGGMPFGLGGMLAFGFIRLLGWLLQIGLIVAIVMWLLRRNTSPVPAAQPPVTSAPPSEPGAPPQA